MKKQTGIWIDTSKAIVVDLSNGKADTTEIESAIENRVYHENEGNKGSFMGSSHVNNEKTFDERKKHQTNDFIDNVIKHIENSDELYIFGPAEIKLKLKQRVESEKNLASKLISVETADSMTLNQIVAKVKDFYKN